MALTAAKSAGGYTRFDARREKRLAMLAAALHCAA
jgi:hypothetical protein